LERGYRRAARRSTDSGDVTGLETPGQRIARARRRRGLSQAVLAGLVGRSESWLSQVERGKRGIDSHAVLTRLAEVLRINIEQITARDAGPEDGWHMYPAASWASLPLPLPFPRPAASFLSGMLVLRQSLT
jgi:transcriptional regulator with XRE-family HTH domain